MSDSGNDSPSVFSFVTRHEEARYRVFIDFVPHQSSESEAVFDISVVKDQDLPISVKITARPAQKSFDFVTYTDTIALASPLVLCLLYCLAGVSAKAILGCFRNSDNMNDFIKCLESEGITAGSEMLACAAECFASHSGGGS